MSILIAVSIKNQSQAPEVKSLFIQLRRVNKMPTMAGDQHVLLLRMPAKCPVNVIGTAKRAKNQKKKEKKRKK